MTVVPQQCWILPAFVSLLFAVPSYSVNAHVSEDFDFIVVGGGVAGCIAADVFASSGLRTLLLESGPPGHAAQGGTDAPTEWGAEALSKGRNLTRFDVPGEYHGISWVLDKYRQNATDWAWQANVLGGGGVVNGAFTMMPSSHDFDKWQPLGWGFDKLQPHLAAVWHDMPPTEHPSRDGQRYLEHTAKVLAAALLSLNFTRKGFNIDAEHRKNTYSYPEVVVEGGKRVSTCLKYLPRALQRANFTLLTEANAGRLLLEPGGKAVGVAFWKDRPRTASLAEGGRVILTAGALNTPRLLIKSGIGPASEVQKLEASQLAPARNLWVSSPGVGARLRDHTYLRMRFSLPGYRSFAWRNRPLDAIHEYLDSFSGPFAQYGPVLAGFMASPWADPDSDAEVEVFIEADATCIPGEPCPEDTFDVFLSLLRPKSMTSLVVNIDHARGYPEVKAAALEFGDMYLKHPDDIRVFQWAVKEVITAMQTAHKDLHLIIPPDSSDEQIAALVVSNWKSSHMEGNHFAQTCELGICVDPKSLAVHGTQNVHVADASLLPSPLGCHPWLGVAAVARKAATDILAAGPCASTAALVSKGNSSIWV